MILTTKGQTGQTFFERDFFLRSSSNFCIIQRRMQILHAFTLEINVMNIKEIPTKYTHNKIVFEIKTFLIILNHQE
jgi:hypothetical protein